DRFFVGAGAVWVQSNVTANLNTGRIGLGTFVDFEDDVGLSKSNVLGLVAFRAHLSERWLLEAEYFRLNRDGEKEISRTIDWGNLNIPLSAVVRGSSSMDDTRVSVAYSFFRTEDKEIGIGIGAHVMRLDATLATRNLGSERASQSAPLPVLTMYAQ